MFVAICGVVDVRSVRVASSVDVGQLRVLDASFERLALARCIVVDDQSIEHRVVILNIFIQNRARATAFVSGSAKRRHTPGERVRRLLDGDATASSASTQTVGVTSCGSAVGVDAAQPSEAIRFNVNTSS